MQRRARKRYCTDSAICRRGRVKTDVSGKVIKPLFITSCLEPQSPPFLLFVSAELANERSSRVHADVAVTCYHVKCLPPVNDHAIPGASACDCMSPWAQASSAWITHNALLSMQQQQQQQRALNIKLWMHACKNKARCVYCGGLCCEHKLPTLRKAEQSGPDRVVLH